MKLSKHDAETLVRLAATIIDAHDAGNPNAIRHALNSFGETDEVEELAREVAQALYYRTENLEIS